MTDLERVQCVIPNNNGMSRGLPELLESLRSQKDVEVQIIVVDSGSIDDSVKYSELMGCTVLHIDPKDFTHANSRNKALDYVDTEYVFYTVNDAFICDDRYLFKALNLTKKYDLAVLSGQQISGQKNLYSQYESMEIAKNFLQTDKVYIINGLLNNIQLMHVDNVNALYKTEVLKKVKFTGDAVEDMITGNKFYQLGFSIGHTAIIKVKHGHVYLDKNEYKSRVLNDVKCYCPKKISANLNKYIFTNNIFLTLNSTFECLNCCSHLFNVSLSGAINIVNRLQLSIKRLMIENRNIGILGAARLFFMSTLIILFIVIKVAKLKQWLKRNNVNINPGCDDYKNFMDLYLSKVEAIYYE